MKKHQIALIGTLVVTCFGLGACRMDVDSISGKADPSYSSGWDSSGYSSSEGPITCTQWRLADVSTGAGAAVGVATAPAAAPSPDPSASPSSSSSGGSTVGSATCESPESALLDAGALYDSAGNFLRLEIRVRQFADGTFPEVAGLIYQGETSYEDSAPVVNVDFNCDPPSINQDSAFAKIDCAPAADTSGKIVSSGGVSYTDIRPFAMTLRHKSCGTSVTYQEKLVSLQGDACNYGYSSMAFAANPSATMPYLVFEKQ